jgi:hypothetical protein
MLDSIPIAIMTITRWLTLESRSFRNQNDKPIRTSVSIKNSIVYIAFIFKKGGLYRNTVRLNQNQLLWRKLKELFALVKLYPGISRAVLQSLNRHY